MNLKRMLFAAAALSLPIFLAAAAVSPANAAVCTSPAPGTCGTATTQGDLNLDGGAVNPADVVAMVQYLVNLIPYPAPLCNGEINGYCNPGPSPLFNCEPTLGDLIVLVDRVYHGAGNFTPCGNVPVPPVSPIRFRYSRWLLVPAGEGNLTFSFRIRNTGRAANLRGFSTPIEAVGSAGVTITSINAGFVYAFPGGQQWSIPRAANRVMVHSYGDPVPLPARGQIFPAVTVTINYNNTTGAEGSIVTGAYTMPPGDINLIHTTAIFLERGPEQQEVVEEAILLYEDDQPDQVPATGTMGQIILILSVLAVGVASFAMYRRYRMA